MKSYRSNGMQEKRRGSLERISRRSQLKYLLHQEEIRPSTLHEVTFIKFSRKNISNKFFEDKLGI